MIVKIIKSKSDYENALIAVEELIDLDPDEGTLEAEKLELLILLIQDYESKRYKKELPDPIEAIRFRMEQQSLRQKDMIPYLGSRSKVSEVLARKRPLTLSMICALHTGLGIPAEVLLQEGDPSYLEEMDIEWHRFPIREMVKRNWITQDAAKADIEKAIRDFLDIDIEKEIFDFAFRKTQNFRTARSINRYALWAWVTQVIKKALASSPDSHYVPGTITLKFMREVAQLSWFEQGPVLAQEFLHKYGISLIIEPHLPKTYLDGAAIRVEQKNPIIGLSIRYDRIDNFWFCLMHELAHIAYHLNDKDNAFYDDQDFRSQEDAREKEADEFAQEALIPKDVWTQSTASYQPTAESVQRLANELRIHPAIVVGRIHYEAKSYRILNRWVGHKQVRRCFPDIDWG